MYDKSHSGREAADEQISRNYRIPMKKTVMKGSASKMVERTDSPEVSIAPKKPALTIQLINKVKELIDAGQPQAAIAKVLEKEESWVRGSLLIATKLPEKVHQAIADGKFSRTTALQLLLAPQAKLDAIIDGALVLFETEGKL